jgi:methyl-accepting chemotaxis protein
MRLCALLVSVLLVAPVLAGCGGKKNSEQDAANSWANDLCQAFDNWQSSVKSATGKLSSGLVSKSGLQDAAGSIADANKKLADDLDSLGKPPTPQAKQIQATLKQLSTSLRDSADKVRTAASGVSSAKDLPAAVSTIGSTLTSMGSDLSAASSNLEGLGNQETWKKAFSQSQECKKLANAG